jgi:hypothetical protein
MERRIGLCEGCLHARTVRSARGAEFYLCRRAERDPRYAKYPRLPVLACAGHELPPDGTRAQGTKAGAGRDAS